MKKLEHQVLKKYLIITIIGFVVLLLGRGIETSFLIYPSYEPSAEIGPEFQYYTLNTFYGASVGVTTEAWDTATIQFTGFRIPIFPLAGYILIILGFGKLSIRSKIFSIGKMMAMLSLIGVVVINILPFIMTGHKLCYVAMLIGIANLGFELSAGYFLLCGICSILTGIAFKSDKVAMAITWCVAALVRVVVFFTTWIQLAGLTLVYNIILFWLWVLFIYFIWKVKEYITGEIPVED